MVDHLKILLVWTLLCGAQVLSQNYKCPTSDLHTSMVDMRKSISHKLDVLDKKLEWMISDGQPEPANTSEILSVLESLKEIQENWKERQSRKIKIRVNSEGCCGKKEEPGIAPLYGSPLFYINDKVAANVHGRGFNIMTVSRATGELLDAKTFDTYGSRANKVALWNYVLQIPEDTIVVVSVIDDASLRCQGQCLDAIREIGGTDLPLTLRDGYALIGYKGTFCGSNPPWMKEKRVRGRYNGGPWKSERTRSGYGTKPISLVAEIDLDHCY